MVKKKGKRSLIIAISILGVLLVAIGTIALIKVMGADKQDPYVLQETSSTEAANNTTEPADNNQTQSGQDASPDTPVDTTEESSLDPATVSTIDIAPMSITISYVKGIGGFEYEVHRANNGTRYVELRSPQLVGTKCTNDAGTFVSIIANPTEGESTTLAKTTTVEGVKYGLSLADATCTSDVAKLQEYQKSFSDAFSLLKKID